MAEAHGWARLRHIIPAYILIPSIFPEEWLQGWRREDDKAIIQFPQRNLARQKPTTVSYSWGHEAWYPHQMAILWRSQHLRFEHWRGHATKLIIISFWSSFCVLACIVFSSVLPSRAICCSAPAHRPLLASHHWPSLSSTLAIIIINIINIIVIVSISIIISSIQNCHSFNPGIGNEI